MQVRTMAQKIAIALGIGTFFIPSLVVAEMSEIQFRGTVASTTEIGAEYIVFKTYKNNQVIGLVYIQNSDIGSCFHGVFNPDHSQIQQITYTYPVIVNATAKAWETNVSDENLSLGTFVHVFDSSEISENIQVWLNQCVEVIL